MTTNAHSIKLHNELKRIGYRVQAVHFEEKRYIYHVRFIYKGYSIPIEYTLRVLEEIWGKNGLDDLLFRRMTDGMLEQSIRTHSSEAQS